MGWVCLERIGINNNDSNRRRHYRKNITRKTCLEAKGLCCQGCRSGGAWNTINRDSGEQD